MVINVIGGSGFIGTRLCQRLRQANVDFSIIDKQISEIFPHNTVIVDVCAASAIKQAVSNAAVIVNLAAEHRDDVQPISLYDQVNVDGARNICAAAREKNVTTIIFTSSVAVYGFAPIGTDETGKIAPFNDYGRTKYEAEEVYKAWQQEEPDERVLVIVRPTVVFGEGNRGNVYNLLRQIASGHFIMIGNGKNRKSMAYVENVAEFLQYTLTNFNPGIHVYNYIDKPDFTMNALVKMVRQLLVKQAGIQLRIPFIVGYGIGKVFDLVACITGRSFTISSIRVKKFCANSVYNTDVKSTGFIPSVELTDALARTIKSEFDGLNKAKICGSQTTS